MQTAQECYDAATAQAEAGAYEEALGNLSQGFRHDVEFKPLYTLAAQILGRLGALEEQSLFEDALAHFSDYAPLNNLGIHFFHVAHYDLARPFLEKAIGIDASDGETRYALALIYARRFEIGRAIEVLEQDCQKVFWSYLFWVKLHILDERTDGVDEALAELSAMLDEDPDPQETILPRQKVEEVRAMLLRYRLVELPKPHIRDWHFIQYGGAILDYFDEGDDYVAGGRYVATWGSSASVRTTAQKLKYLLALLDVPVTGVYYLDNRNAEIVARVIAETLGTPVEPYYPDDVEGSGLIVGGETSDFNDSQELGQITSPHTLFALNHNWLEPALLTPDIIGLMSQYYIFPWDGGLEVTDGATQESEPDDREPEVIAAEICTLEAEPYAPAVYDFYKEHQRYLQGIGEFGGTMRHNFMCESPVPGTYFGGAMGQ